MATKTTHRLPLRALRAVRSALEHADMDGPRCALPEEHRAAVKLYLDTWVRGPLLDVLRWDAGEIDAEGMTRWT